MWGFAPKRNGRGCYLKGLDNLNQYWMSLIMKFVNKVEHVCKEFLESDLLFGLKQSKHAGQWNTLLDGQDSLFAAIACGDNVFLNSHHDLDFFLYKR